ncbi:unnamed protein product [Adineta steineri]|uniref:G domain-containing protein n=1 Tax=Adineta steineri TaxID=433720 RepID=A0A815C0H9_9BILA|nr:unnamed protein product [Adineta steineri]CAF1461528.1 unnamed protein product [Adineta steineri]
MWNCIMIIHLLFLFLIQQHDHITVATEFSEESIKTFSEQFCQENGFDCKAPFESYVDKYLQDPKHKDILLNHIRTKNDVNRIMVVGHAGAGKSSLINLLMKNDKAKVSSAAVGCTFNFDEYQTVYDDEFYEFIDTVGLNEGSRGTVPARKAIKELINFIKKNKRGFNIILFVMKQGRLDDSFEKNHVLFYQALLENKIPAILFVSHCEQDDPMDTWIKNEINAHALDSYKFAEIVCGTTREPTGRFAKYIPALREESYQQLWTAIKRRKLDHLIAIEADLNLFKRIWNYVCEYFHVGSKFLSDRFHEFLKYLKEMGIDDETIKQINKDLH